jgi:2-polyprenyl-6-methoxyphenol hydroxylase-like FAD-dependent oxidoreductase
MGVLGAIEAAGAAQLSGLRVRAPNGVVIHGEFVSSHGFRCDCGLALPRRQLDALLLDRARHAGARVLEQSVVRDLARSGTGRVEGIDIETDAGRRTLRAPLVVGADGLRTVVGRRLGLTRTGRFPRRVAVVAHYGGVDGMGRCGEMHVDASGYLGLADVGHGMTNVAVVVPAAAARAIGGAPGDFSTSDRRRHPRDASPGGANDCARHRSVQHARPTGLTPERLSAMRPEFDPLPARGSMLRCTVANC